MKEVMGVISPEGLPQGAISNVARHLDTLDGKTIGEVYNNHFKGELMFQTYRRLFKEKYKNVKIIPFTEFPIVYVGGDAESQKKIAKEIAELAKLKGVDAIITGNFTVEGSTNLAVLLRAGALPAEMTFLEERTVGPELGQDSIDAGQIAAITGMVLVGVFMQASYGIFGFFANITLVIIKG